MVNIYDDLSATALNQTGMFKQLTGGSLVRGERKFKDEFYFVNKAKMIFACNELPETKDKSMAFFDRIGLITFPYRFVEDPKDDMEKKVKNRDEIVASISTDEEMAGIFNWAIEGLKRLYENNAFSHSKSSEEVRTEYERKSNPVAAFVEDEMEYAEDGASDKKEAYARYVDYCKKNKYGIKSYNSFCRTIIAVFGSKVTEEQPKLGDKRVRLWIGVQLKGESDKEEEKIGESLDNYG
jgi:putative DNA primase/helicase